LTAILGLWDGHDSGAAVFVDGRLAAAVNEERLTRRKLEIAFPRRSMAMCLALAGLSAADIGIVATCTSDPAKMIGRMLPATKERYYQVRRRKAVPGLLSRATRFAKYRITEWRPNPVSRALNRVALARELEAVGLGGKELRLFDHHLCHAHTAAHGSGFERCAVLTIDGVGDGLSAAILRFDRGRLEPVRATPSTHSLGVFFEHVTRLMNMRELEDEGKVMALADFAAPIADEANPMLSWVRVIDGRLHCTPPSRRLARPLARVQWAHPNEQFAYLAQRCVEKCVVALVDDAVKLTGLPRVAIAGGVASNVKATRLARLLPAVEDLYVFPHMGDGGLAVGAALAAGGSNARALDLSSLALGPSYGDDDIEAAVRAAGVQARRAPDIAACAAALVLDGRIVLWFQGRMVFGPRALGHRSVLARADRPDLKDRLNLALKRRVWYQPFCPSMLESEADRVLADREAGGRGNRHMTMAYMVRPEHRASLAGVINVDGSCRPQIVPDDADGPFAALLRRVREQSGVGVVLNTSFNIHGEPLVCSPAEALDVFRRSGADALAIGSFLVERA
jgi:carbamoyltransferase